LIVADIVENEEFQLRTEVGDVGDPGGLHVVDRLAAHIARIARIILLGERVLNIANHGQSSVFAEGINESSFRLGNDQHVGFIDRLPAANGRAVEAETFLEGILV